MAFAHKIFFLGFIFNALIIKYYFVNPVPPVIQLKWTYSFQIGCMDLIADFSRLLSLISGIDGRISVRLVFDFLGELTAGDVHENIKVYDDVFDGVTVRIYEPKNGTIRGGMLYLHGGGFLAGTPRVFDELCGEIAAQTSSVIVSVHYRRTPEHTSPDLLHDVALAYNYFANHASTWNVDSNFIGIAGDSAGGNLAASYSLMSSRGADSLYLKPCYQILFYPLLQGINVNLPSHHLNSYHVSPFLQHDLLTGVITSYITGLSDHYLKYVHVFEKNQQIELAMRKKYDRYLNISFLPNDYIPDDYESIPDYEEDEMSVKSLQHGLLDPYNFPLMANDLSQLPPAFILTCQHDPLRDEGYLYYYRLKNADNNVAYMNSMDGWHGMIQDFRSSNPAKTALSSAISFIESQLQTPNQS